MLASYCVDHIGSALLKGCSPILTQGHLHNPEPCPPWVHVYLFSVEPTEVRVERTLSLSSLSYHWIHLLASENCLLSTNRKYFPAGQGKQEDFHSCLSGAFLCAALTWQCFLCGSHWHLAVIATAVMQARCLFCSGGLWDLFGVDASRECLGHT